MTDIPKPSSVTAAQREHAAAFYNAVVEAYEEARSYRARRGA